MRRGLVVLLCCAFPAIAEETQDRSKPIFGLEEDSALRSFHLPEALAPGGRLLRVQFEAGFVDHPWDETYVIETNEDERPAILRHEVRVWTQEGRRERAAGQRVLSGEEVARINAGIRAIRLCASGPDEGGVVDAPMVFIEFANAARYCFAARVPWDEIEPDYGAFLDLVRGLAGEGASP